MRRMHPVRLSKRYWIGQSPWRRKCAKSLTHAVNAHILPEQYPPTQIFTSDSGIQGEVLRLECCAVPSVEQCQRAASCHVHIIVLPGNPGVIEFYRPFVRMLWQQLRYDIRSRFHIHALGLPGHDLRELNGKRQFGIPDHVEYCTSYLRSKALVPSMTKSRLVFIGHSYGSFLALRITENLASDKQSDLSLIMLMPALWRMAYCCGAFIRFILTDWFGLISWTLWLVTAVIPPIIREAFLSVSVRDEEIKSVSRSMIDGTRRYLYGNIGRLGRDEKVQITDPRRLSSVDYLTGRSLMVYVNEDKWCPPTGRRAIVDAFNGFVDVVTPGGNVEHAFVMSQGQSVRVVGVIVPWILERFCVESKNDGVANTDD